MKYKDYLILPALIMYIVFTSCAFIAKTASDEAEGTASQPVPTASVDPGQINWAGSGSEDGEYWYADGTRGGDSFFVDPEDRSNNISFSTGERRGSASEETTDYYIKDMHMCAQTGTGREYDLIFLDEVTAYDCVSGVYYQRADGDTIRSQLLSGKFQNTTNDRDYYIFRENGKSYEYFGTQLFKGEWTLDTSDTVRVYDYSCQEDFCFQLLFDSYGCVSGFTFNELEYDLMPEV